MRLPEIYGIIDNEVMFDQNITFQARALYALLCAYADDQYQCHPGNERLARDLGCSEKTITRYIKELKEKGIIKRYQRGFNGIAHIQILHGPKFRMGYYYVTKYDRNRPAVF